MTSEERSRKCGRKEKGVCSLLLNYNQKQGRSEAAQPCGLQIFRDFILISASRLRVGLVSCSFDDFMYRNLWLGSYSPIKLKSRNDSLSGQAIITLHLTGSCTSFDSNYINEQLENKGRVSKAQSLAFPISMLGFHISNKINTQREEGLKEKREERKKFQLGGLDGGSMAFLLENLLEQY